MAVILDLFSRKVVGWKLGENLEAELVVTALQNALTMRTPDRGLYFHSDRGSQYSSQAVRKALEGDRSQLQYEWPGPKSMAAKSEERSASWSSYMRGKWPIAFFTLRRRWLGR